MKAFRIIFEDNDLLIVDKPPGFHCVPPESKSIRISPAWNGLKILERQFQQKLYPAHRLDRATSGIFLLTKSKEMASITQKQFADRSTKKIYACVVRGRMRSDLSIDTPLKKPDGQLSPAKTNIHFVSHFSLAIKNEVADQREFSLIFAQPETGRFHQIRRHLANIGHPIMGDKMHGDKKLNRAFSEMVQSDRLFLRAMQLELNHPETQQRLIIRNKWNKDWHKIFPHSEVCPIL